LGARACSADDLQPHLLEECRMTDDKRVPPSIRRVASNLLLNVRDLVNWGIESGNTTPEKIRLTVAARREAAQKLIEGGMSQAPSGEAVGGSSQHRASRRGG
jgi:hypothetical protein